MRKMIVSIVMMVLLTAMAAGCQNKEVRKETSEKITEPLLVFFDNGCEPLVQNFKAVYPNVELEARNMNGMIEEYINKYGEPDIILGGGLQYLAGNGYIADITELYEQDHEFDSGLYFKGVMEGCKVGESLFALPLTVSFPYMTIEKSKWENSEFAFMPENYDGLDLLQAMNVELEKAEGRENYLVFGKEYVYFPDWLHSLGAIEEKEEGTTIDPEVFEALYRMQLNLQRNRAENDPLVERFYLPYSPSVMGDTYLAVSFGQIAPPQTGLILENSIYKGYNGESIKAIWRPTVGEERCYIASMTSIGMVGAKTDQKQEAYDVLRMMMDMPIAQWVVSTGHFMDNTPCPVHIENAKQLIEIVETTGQEFFLDYEPNTREEMYNVPKETLSEEMKMEIYDVLDHVEVRTKDAELLEQIQECVTPYLESNSSDHERCYQEVMAIIDSYYN